MASYIVATIRPWNIKVYHDIIKHYPGEWHLVTEPEALTVNYVSEIGPRYIFFPHWSWIVPSEILALSECVCFHETDLPYGRGGSPIQNLIKLDFEETQVTALKMTEDLDAGPIYIKRPLCLAGRGAEDIYIDTAYIVAAMILWIINTEPEPSPQSPYSITDFKRRTPEQSRIENFVSGLDLFDHIRMLDAEGYPPAFLDYKGFRYHFTRAALRTEGIEADVWIEKL